MGCSTSSQTSTVDPARPGSKREESNGASTTGAANENGNVAEDSVTLPDQSPTVTEEVKAEEATPAAAAAPEETPSPSAPEEPQPAAAASPTPEAEAAPAAEAPTETPAEAPAEPPAEAAPSSEPAPEPEKADATEPAATEETPAPAE